MSTLKKPATTAGAKGNACERVKKAMIKPTNPEKKNKNGVELRGENVKHSAISFTSPHPIRDLLYQDSMANFKQNNIPVIASDST